MSCKNWQWDKMIRPEWGTLWYYDRTHVPLSIPWMPTSLWWKALSQSLLVIVVPMDSLVSSEYSMYSLLPTMNAMKWWPMIFGLENGWCGSGQSQNHFLLCKYWLCHLVYYIDLNASIWMATSAILEPQVWKGSQDLNGPSAHMLLTPSETIQTVRCMSTAVQFMDGNNGFSSLNINVTTLVSFSCFSPLFNILTVYTKCISQNHSQAVNMYWRKPVSCYFIKCSQFAYLLFVSMTGMTRNGITIQMVVSDLSQIWVILIFPHIPCYNCYLIQVLQNLHQ